MDKKIAAIVVTYNRKELLSECLAAVCAQEYKPVVAYVIDNASTDGTDEWIKNNGYNGEKESIAFRYVRLPENIGGSGGFYTGLKMAHESEEMFDAFWLMDDDGVADKEQLKNLVAHLDQYDYLSPLVIAKEEPTRCAFYNMTVEEFKQKAINGLVPNEACPFNGVIYSRQLVDKVGYPIRDMFIWGDENNYHCRCIKASYPPVAVIDALHVHPRDRQVWKKLMLCDEVVPEQDWKLFLYVRNSVYNIKVLSHHKRYIIKKVARLACEYIYYFTFKQPSFHKIKIVSHAIYDGIREDFSHSQYYR